MAETPSPTPPPVSPSDAALTRKAILVLLWLFSLFFLGFACTAAAAVADSRLENGYVAPNVGPLLAGAIRSLPFTLPLVLLPLGLRAYRSLAGAALATGPDDAPASAAAWGRVQAALLVMLGLFELNFVVGLALFFALGAPVGNFFWFAGGAFVLLCVGLWRLMTSWPLR